MIETLHINADQRYLKYCDSTKKKVTITNIMEIKCNDMINDLIIT